MKLIGIVFVVLAAAVMLPSTSAAASQGPERKLTQDLSTLTSSLGNLGGGSLPTNFNVGDVASTVTNLAGSGNGGNLASTASSFLGGASGSGGTSMISNLAGTLGGRKMLSTA